MAENDNTGQDMLHQMESKGESETDIMGLLSSQTKKIQNILKQNHTRTLIPDYFHGYPSEDPKFFLDQFSTWTILQDVTEEDKKLHLRMMLKGPAEVWYMSLPETTKNDWNSLETAFLSWFGGPSTTVKLQETLDNRRQLPDETLDFYINDVLRLGQRLNASDREIIRALIRGVPPEIQSFVIGQNTKTVTDTVQKMKLFAAAKEIQVDSQATPITQLNQTVYPVTKLSTPRPDYSQKNTGLKKKIYIICGYCGHSGHKTRECLTRPKCDWCGKRNHSVNECHSLHSTKF